MNKQGASRTAFLSYLALIIYGSLIPFDYRDLSMDVALQRFADIPWLDLAAASRADWVANLVLYIPLGFLGCAALAGGERSSASRHLWTLFVLGLCLLTAVAVEFIQLFFAPRTVSLNDLLAECLGSLSGIALWTLAYHRLVMLWRAFLAGGRPAITAAMVGYAGLYLTLGLFPFDFVVSGAELAAKAAAGSFGWLLAHSDAGMLKQLASLITESAAILPIGLLMGLLVPNARAGRALAIGLVLGLILEAMQFLLVSGITQGLSILMRGLGLAAGTLLGAYTHRHGPQRVARAVRRLSLPLLPFYLLGLAAVSGWLSHDLLDSRSAWTALAETRLLPFYYHYFTSEPVAMASLLANVALYAPLGMLAWARHLTVPKTRRRGRAEPALWAVALALPVETGKAWLAGAHPDFTNLLIAPAGALFAYALAHWLTQASGHRTPTATPEEAAAPKAATPGSHSRSWPAPLFLAVSLAALGLLLAGVWHYPTAKPLLALMLVGYGVLLWRRPWAWLLVLPAALPVLDFAPQTGRLPLDAFDLLVITTVGVGYWQTMALPVQSRAFSLAAPLLLGSGLLAIGLGLWPALHGEPLTLAASHSPLEALMAGKGILGALLLLPLLRRIPAEALVASRQLLINGLSLGLVLLSLAVLWERHIFVGLGEFEGDFRVTGPFSAMYNGGAYIEAYIALAFPALAAWILQQRTSLPRLLGILMAALASYAMLVTFSRGGYAGLVAGLAVAGYGVWRGGRGTKGRRPLWLAGVSLAVVTAATPVLLGGFAQARLAQSQRDLQVRFDHWGHAIDLMAQQPLSWLVGMGLGRYPAAYLWQGDSDKPPGTFAVLHEAGSSFLRLGGGDNYYLDQLVTLDPTQGYTLRVQLRFQGQVDKLSVPLCEKALLTSFRCHEYTFERTVSNDGWASLEQALQPGELGQTGRWPPPSLKLSLAAPTASGAVDVRLVSLRDSAGNEQLDNGDFGQGLAHWLPATDRDLAWHIHQTPLEVFFAQGLLGLAALAAVLWSGLRQVLPGYRDGSPFQLMVAGGLTGVVTVGLLGSTLDTGRLALMIYLLAFSAVLTSARTAGKITAQ